MAYPYIASTEIRLESKRGDYIYLSNYKDPMLNEWVRCHSEIIQTKPTDALSVKEEK